MTAARFAFAPGEHFTRYEFGAARRAGQWIPVASGWDASTCFIVPLEKVQVGAAAQESASALALQSRDAA